MPDKPSAAGETAATALASRDGRVGILTLNRPRAPCGR